MFIPLLFVQVEFARRHPEHDIDFAAKRDVVSGVVPKEPNEDELGFVCWRW